MIKKGTLPNCLHDHYIGFDAEWTKNYKIKNGNIPFCFSVVTVKKQDFAFDILQDGKLPFEYIQYYCEKEKDIYLLIEECNRLAKSVCNSLGSCTLCGHQISSDFGVLINAGCFLNIAEIENIQKLHSLWHQRKSSRVPLIIDTRYDVLHDFMGTSRRLVDICNDFMLCVTQQELATHSMTKLHNQFLSSVDQKPYERIAVMNLRHSLSAIILSWLDDEVKSGMPLAFINLNKSIYSKLQYEFEWINTKEFGELLSEGD